MTKNMKYIYVKIIPDSWQVPFIKLDGCDGPRRKVEGRAGSSLGLDFTHLQLPVLVFPGCPHYCLPPRDLL